MRRRRIGVVAAAILLLGGCSTTLDTVKGIGPQRDDMKASPCRRPAALHLGGPGKHPTAPFWRTAWTSAEPVACRPMPLDTSRPTPDEWKRMWRA